MWTNLGPVMARCWNLESLSAPTWSLRLCRRTPFRGLLVLRNVPGTARYAGSFNPPIVDGVMYVVGKDSSICAFDAATGRQIWVHLMEGHPTNRGFSYLES